jgi:ubiquinone biosynthesis monooxygenase Coq7
MRQLTFIDRLLFQVDSAVRTIFPPEHRQCQRENPARDLDAVEMDADEMRHVAGLMRVNHAGEVCAQALYQGQACTARLTTTRAQMQQAAEEEIDHLAWCEQRLQELDSQPSQLNVLWYGGSFLLGAIAGLAGDRWSLGFVAETERQVTAHLQRHLEKIPQQDLKTRAILTQMQVDEAHHAELAHAAGAAMLPDFVKSLMNGVSKLLTFGSYRI